MTPGMIDWVHGMPSAVRGLSKMKNEIVGNYGDALTWLNEYGPSVNMRQTDIKKKSKGSPRHIFLAVHCKFGKWHAHYTFRSQTMRLSRLILEDCISLHFVPISGRPFLLSTISFTLILVLCDLICAESCSACRGTIMMGIPLWMRAQQQ